MRLVRIVALTIAVLGCAAVASANTIWNFNNVVFNRPGFGTNTVTGSITLIGTGANVVTGIASYDFTVAGANAAANFHYVSASSAGSIFYSAHDLAFFGPGFNPFVDFLFAADLTNAGGSVNLVGGPAIHDVGSYVCPGCGTLVSGGVTTTSIAAVATPEPATLVLVGLGAMFAASRLRRRQ